MHIALGLAYAGLGRSVDAARAAERALRLAPLSRSFPGATATMGGVADIYVRVRDHDRALQLLDQLLQLSAGREASVALLRIDPTWDAPRRDVRFQRLPDSVGSAALACAELRRCRSVRRRRRPTCSWSR